MADDFDPQVGDLVCDCAYRHVKVIERDGDDLVLEGGFRCSLRHCIDEPNHGWSHPPGDSSWNANLQRGWCPYGKAPS